MGLFVSLQKLAFPQEVGRNEKNLEKNNFSVLEKNNFGFGKNKSAPIPIPILDLVLVPDTETWFGSHTTKRCSDVRIIQISIIHVWLHSGRT